MRLKCRVSYDGSEFQGFQIQPKGRTIQGEIQNAIKEVTQSDVTIHAAGRTDAGVHAYGQVFHFDTKKELPDWQWKRALNHFLPEDIHILDVTKVDESFHSRYSACWKSYRYLVNTGEYDPIQASYVTQLNRPLQLEKMRECAKVMTGCHNFASFCAQDPYGNTYRTIYQITIKQNGSILVFDFAGDGFRRFMVRYLMGALLQVGLGKWSLEKVSAMVESAGAIKCLNKAKANGLYLVEVGYDAYKI